MGTAIYACERSWRDRLECPEEEAPTDSDRRLPALPVRAAMEPVRTTVWPCSHALHFSKVIRE